MTRDYIVSNAFTFPITFTESNMNKSATVKLPRTHKINKAAALGHALVANRRAKAKAERKVTKVRVPNVRLAKGVIQPVRFVAGKDKFFCRSKGQPTIVVHKDGKGFLAMAAGCDGATTGSDASKVFARAVRKFWS